jgi:hypothetical protein
VCFKHLRGFLNRGRAIHAPLGADMSSRRSIDERTTRPQPLGQALALQFALAQALVVPWWDLALAQGSTKAWHALVVPWLTEIHQG